MNTTVKHLVKYYENLSFVSSILVGIGLHFSERSRGLGICGFFSALFFLFVVILSLVYRNVLTRGATAQYPILLIEVWTERIIDLSLFFGVLFLLLVMTLLCVPQVTFAVPEIFNFTNPYESVVTFEKSLIDVHRLPLLMAFVTSLLVAGFMTFLFWLIISRNQHLEKAQRFYLEKDRMKAVLQHEEI